MTGRQRWWRQSGGGGSSTATAAKTHQLHWQRGDLSRQANLKESSKSKELAELRLQVLVVVIANDACESKKRNYDLESDLQGKDREHTIQS